MASIFFLGKTVLTVCLYIIILRLWMQRMRVNFNNPFTQFIVKITQPIVGRLRQFIPSIGRFDTATWIILYVFALIKIMFVFSYGTINAPLFNIDYLWFAVVAIIHAIGHLLFWLLLFRAIFSWINRGQTFTDELLAQLTEPLIAPIRRLVPPIGYIDISFIIVAFILIFLNLLGNDIFGVLWILL
ncbi:hypothetical protein A9G11_05720 [Gilliamella sp. wkB108]|uniref:YggT family protein n=1 Tax=Gilliamella sp. wkB108 TaxID=3120256 RepID=UPI00080E85D6|nr:YggT family protein [Gilliamella apicola]OCG23457.1 hypothetical protein A9G11_05720 [Gilliamella apicola]